MSCAVVLDPRLPLDVERMIFELAVSQHGMKASTQLVLIAKRVREWMLPLMFRVVNQIWPSRSPGHRLIDVPELLQSRGPLVQHLMIDDYSVNGSFQTVLSSCPNICNLAIYLPKSYSERKLYNLSPILQGMKKLTRLSASLPEASYVDILIQPPHFSNLTHLEMFLASWEERWGVLTKFPKLTHVSVEGNMRAHEIVKLLDDCRHLELLIVVPLSGYFHAPQSERDALHAVEDNRLVFLEPLHYVDVLFDWEKGAHGGLDSWVFAELVIVARARGYFLTRLPNCIPRSFDDWETNLNEEGRQWFFELQLKDQLKGAKCELL
ncbi:hypothetical protein M413DRAFT_29235 [Hebeloma cylindrosporum]|uniref:F-box domain-containing protein n=1 Tax=Hebeloma cylindrosporum TaxID=76867 RepID=A0A0C2YEP4_HEBCY|nr:hypothetical protein M413DRAFT_29235 [Hebeloma cylindrosporum h7]